MHSNWRFKQSFRYKKVVAKVLQNQQKLWVLKRDIFEVKNRSFVRFLCPFRQEFKVLRLKWCFGTTRAAELRVLVEQNRPRLIRRKIVFRQKYCFQTHLMLSIGVFFVIFETYWSVFFDLKTINWGKTTLNFIMNTKMPFSWSVIHWISMDFWKDL